MVKKSSYVLNDVVVIHRVSEATFDIVYNKRFLSVVLESDQSFDNLSSGEY